MEKGIYIMILMAIIWVLLVISLFFNDYFKPKL